MAKIVGIHGIGHRGSKPDDINQEWLEDLRASMQALPDCPCIIQDYDLTTAFYGDIFLQRDGEDKATRQDMERWEEEYASALGLEVASLMGLKADTGPLLKRSLHTLTSSVLGYVLEWFVTEASRYFHIPALRQKVQQRMINELKPETRIVIAHSMGSVVAYEALVQTGHPLELFLTIGSPLGIRDLFFDRLQPPPQNDLAVWPGNVKRWVNLTQLTDWVSLERDLQGLFARGPQGQGIEQHLIAGPEPARQSHLTDHYLRRPEVAQAVASVLCAP